MSMRKDNLLKMAMEPLGIKLNKLGNLNYIPEAHFILIKARILNHFYY